VKERKEPLAEVLDQAYRLWEQAVLQIESLSDAIEDLRQKLDCEWRCRGLDPECFDEASVESLGELREQLDHMVVTARRQQARVLYQVKERFHTDAPLSPHKPSFDSTSAALLGLLQTGSMLRLHRVECGTLGAFDVRAAVFVLRALGWQIDRWVSSENGDAMFALHDDFAPLWTQALSVPVLTMTEGCSPPE
jgi:hypothetical protein